MTDSNEPCLPTKYTRPDLSAAEQLLGESLAAPANRLSRYRTAANADPSGIPWGPYCYDPELENSPFCPHFAYTEIGMVRCAHLNILAYTTFFDEEAAFVQTHFESVEAAEAAGVVDDITLRDRYKVCGVNVRTPGRAMWLGSLIDDYRAEVESQPRIAAPTAEKPGFDFTEMTRWRICTAWTRFELWEYMTGMVEDIPLALIHDLMVADKRFRVKTFPTTELMDPDFAQRMPPHDDPKRQYWYMYRKNLGNPEPHELLHDPIGFFPPAHPKAA